MTARAATQTFPSVIPTERRQFGRRAIVRHAWILTSAQQRIACCIRDVSEGGALLELVVPAGLPERFTLLLEGGGISAICEVRRKGRDSIGVSFANPQEAKRFNALGAEAIAKSLATSIQQPTQRRDTAKAPCHVEPAFVPKPQTVICLPPRPSAAE